MTRWGLTFGTVDFSFVAVADFKTELFNQIKIVAYYYQTKTKIYIKAEFRVKNTTTMTMGKDFVKAFLRLTFKAIRNTQLSTPAKRPG